MSGISDQLKQFPFLAGIDPAELEALSEMLSQGHFEAGTDIITEGETGVDMYLLTDGTVDIIRKTVFGDSYVCATLDSSNHCVFGEMALIDSDVRSATVHAKTACSVLKIDKASFDRYLDVHPKTGIILLKLISTNLVRNLREENNNLKLVYQALIDEIENS
ncbi:MAG: cyclic nucleotide-binding domain-containing protein [Lachnospiraceae bacterium]|nr:cyclic nucleotide-binding domain-containing protein [Lachnospiraceae bacterium]